MQIIMTIDVGHGAVCMVVRRFIYEGKIEEIENLRLDQRVVVTR